MESVLLVVHVIVALVIIGLIMLQQGKGADMGASFGGGSSQTVFGSGGSGNFFSRMTAFLVAVFFVTSFVLALLAQQSVSVDEVAVPELQKVIEPADDSAAEGEIPTINEQTEAGGEIPVLDSSDEETPSPEASTTDSEEQ